MRRPALCLLAALLVLASLPALAADPTAWEAPGLPPVQRHDVTYYATDFAPDGHCDLRRAAVIDTAQRTVDYHAFQLQSRVIQQALIRAAQRGVRVRLLVDFKLKPKDDKPDKISAQGLLAAGVLIRVDACRHFAHIKGGVIDGQVILEGSFNDSPNALRNVERCPCVASVSAAQEAQAFSSAAGTCQGPRIGCRSQQAALGRAKSRRRT